MLGHDYQGQQCSIARTLEVIGERWTLLILRDALYGVRRFNDFRAHLDVPKAILSDRLGGLVADGVLERVPDPSRAGRYLYQLTAAGRDLWPVVHALVVWGDRYREASSRTFRHVECAAELDEHGACSRCGAFPGPGDVLAEQVRPNGRGDPVAVALRFPHRLLQPLPKDPGPPNALAG